MNTAELKPIDARIMKPGDPVVHRDGRPGRFLIDVPEAHEDWRTLCIFKGDKLPGCFTFDGKIGLECYVFLPPDPDPIDPSPGNVDKLRKSQVGEGWRIPAHDEKPDRRAQRWTKHDGNWDAYCGPAHGCQYVRSSTYRVPIAPIRVVPLAMEDFIGKPWPLVRPRGTTQQHLIVSVYSGGVGVPYAPQFLSWDKLQEEHELSHDHGKTWVMAEKEEQAM